MDKCVRCSYSLHNLEGIVCPECGFPNDPDSVAAFRARHTRRLALTVCGGLILLASICCITTSIVTPLGPNLGLPVGYYGDLNRTKRHIRAIKGVKIEEVHANYDLSVEEFAIDVVIDDLHRTTIYFPQGSLSQCLRIVDDWEQNVLPSYRNP